MKKLLLGAALFVIGIVLPVNAQSYEDVVHLKNGSVVRGVIVEQTPNKSLKIETRDGNISVYTIDEVEKLTKEKSRRRNSISRKTIRPRKFFNKPQGYMKIIEVGSSPLKMGEFGAVRVSASMINGWRFSPQFAVGAGVGVETFIFGWDHIYPGNNSSYEGGTHLSVPVFLHLRSDFLNGSISPFISCNLGYAVPVIGCYNGLMLDSSLGVGFNVGSKNRLTIGVGYAMNQIKYTFSNSYSGYVSGKGISDGFKLKVGFSF